MSDRFAEAKKSFDVEGYAVLREFISKEETDDVKRNVARYISEVVPTVPREHVFYEDKEDPDSLKQMPNMDEHDTYFHDLLFGSRFERLSEVLLDGPVVPRNLQYLRKPARIGLPTPPHQDGYYFMIEPCVALTGWFCLGSADHENGCLRYIRGSHKKGLRHHARTQTLGFSQGITDFGTPDDLANEKAYRAEPGDLLIHHALTIHRADGNQNEVRDRPALGFVYISDRAKEDQEGGEAYRKKLAENLASQGKI